MSEDNNWHQLQFDSLILKQCKIDIEKMAKHIFQYLTEPSSIKEALFLANVDSSHDKMNCILIRK